MRKKFFIAAFAATVFTCGALGMAACSKDSANGTSSGGGGGGGGGGSKAPYTITLDANGGKFAGGETTSTIKTDKSGNISTAPAAPSTAKTDCTFKGWGRSASTKYVLTFPYKFDESATVYAVWEDNGGVGGGGGEEQPTEYTITFDANGGTFTEDVAPVTRQTDHGQITNAMLPEVNYEGKTLEGWFTAKSGGSLVTAYEFTSSVTVYAVWKDNGGGGGGDIPVGDPNAALTYETVSGAGAWIVGEVAAKDMTWAGGGWDKGFAMERADHANDDGSKTNQYAITVYLEAGDVVKIRYNSTAAASGEGVGYSQIPDNEWNGTAPGLAHISNDNDDNLVIDDAGYYTFYFKFEWGSDKIWLDYSETAPV